jgi:hypothetical protein
MPEYTEQEWGTGDFVTPGQMTDMSAELDEQETHDVTQDERLDALTDADVRTGVFPFALPNSLGSWNAQPFSMRRQFMVAQRVQRFRVHFRNRNQHGNTLGGDITGLRAFVGVPAFDTNGAWYFGNLVDPPTEILTPTTMAGGAEVVTPWVDTDDYEIEPYKRYVLSYGFVTPATAGANTAFGSGTGWRSFSAENAGHQYIETPALAERVTNSGWLQVWIEYQFVDAEAPVMFIVTNSIGDGQTAAFDSQGELNSHLQVWAWNNSGVAANAGVGGGLASHFETANERWQVYDTCEIPLDPDIVFYDALASSDIMAGAFPWMLSFIAAVQRGVEKFPNARHVASNIPPRSQFTGDSVAGMERGRLDFNLWLHMLPGLIESVVDFDSILNNAADPARIPPALSQDGIHPSPQGHHQLAQIMPAYRRRR